MFRILSITAVAILTGSLFVIADPPPKADAKIAALIEDLGSEVYLERETAEKDLEAHGERAIELLKAATKSPNPEICRRATDVLTRIERKVGNDKALAPTIVELNFKQATVSELMAELSRQSKYNVFFGGSDKGTVTARTEVAIETGKVPFFEVVVKVCDIADLQIASVGGFVAPGAAMSSIPPTTDTIVLLPRGSNPKRPASVHGAVLVETFEIPRDAAVSDSSSAVLQVWAEPKLNWQATKGVSVRKAEDNVGQLLAAKPSIVAEPPQVFNGRNVRVVKNVQGGVVLVNPGANVPLPAVPNFTPNLRQAVLSLKPGEMPSASLKAVTGSVHGTVRSKADALVSLDGMKPGKPYEASHLGVSLKATLTKTAAGNWQAAIDVHYDEAAIQPENLVRANHSLMGLRITNAAGSTFRLNHWSYSHNVIGTNSTRRFSMDLLSDNPDIGEPVSVSFWGTYPKPVEVPFALKDVPLAGGKK